MILESHFLIMGGFCMALFSAILFDNVLLLYGKENIGNSTHQKLIKTQSMKGHVVIDSSCELLLPIGNYTQSRVYNILSSVHRCGNTGIRAGANLPCTRNSCNNNGYCIVKNNGTPIEYHDCICDYGHRGHYCEKEFSSHLLATGLFLLAVALELIVLIFSIMRHNRQKVFDAYTSVRLPSQKPPLHITSARITTVDIARTGNPQVLADTHTTPNQTETMATVHPPDPGPTVVTVDPGPIANPTVTQTQNKKP